MIIKASENVGIYLNNYIKDITANPSPRPIDTAFNVTAINVTYDMINKPLFIKHSPVFDPDDPFVYRDNMLTLEYEVQNITHVIDFLFYDNVQMAIKFLEVFSLPEKEFNKVNIERDYPEVFI